MKKDIKDFIAKIENETKRKDSVTLLKIMEEESGFKAWLYGNIIGFGQYHYKYDSGREGDAIVTGFAPRKQNLTIYIMPGFPDYKKELDKLGKHKASKCCLYINKLADVDEKILRKIIKRSVSDMTKKYDCKNG